MRVLYSPQLTVDDKKVTYEFKGDVITATLDGITDMFDFSTFTNDGEIDKSSISTTLSINPVLSAKRENGVLSVVLFNLIGDDATDEEKFPNWIEVV